MIERKITLNNKEIKYNLKKSQKARHMRLTIYCDGSLVATVPRRFSDNALQEFILEKAGWILKKIDYFQNFGQKHFWKQSPDDFLKYREAALELVLGRIEYFNRFYGFHYGKITIRNQKTRWGSCSRNGNLSFNYKIVFLPPSLADYIVVHELCHLREFNHSSRFWKLVGRTIIDHKQRRQEARRL